MSQDGSFEELVSYGQLIGLQTALACKTREQIQECLSLVEKYRARKFAGAIKNGNAEYDSWRVELEMQMWQRDMKSAGKPVTTAHRSSISGGIDDFTPAVVNDATLHELDTKANQ